ncbi:hypothetical protein K4L44_15330 [Halosquirtibacter laminarini]|uniref:Uncharacterized protein n=1 Tax=Halosquirtibacter laminarini TaxID=3374600 RepID=A0AC61NE95_9BACT|nr:hypothetical protein K4L44_15330 [Prolixibacteraceae bacterium]
MRRVLLLFVVLFVGQNLFSQEIGIELIGGFNVGDANKTYSKGLNLKYGFSSYLSAVVGYSKWDYKLSGEWLTEKKDLYLNYTIQQKGFSTWIPSFGVEGSLPFLENKIHSLGFTGKVVAYLVPSVNRDVYIHQEGFVLNDENQSDATVQVDKMLTYSSEGTGALGIGFVGGLYYRYKKFRTNLTVEQNSVDLFYDYQSLKLDDNVFMSSLLNSPGMIMWSMSASYYFNL